MRSDTLLRVDWDVVPRHIAHAHVLRSAEMRRLTRATLAGFVRFARRLVGRRTPPGLRAAGC